MSAARPVHDRVPAYLWRTLSTASAERRQVVRRACLAPAPTADERLGQRAVMEALDLIEAAEIERDLAQAAGAAAAVLARLRPHRRTLAQTAAQQDPTMASKTPTKEPSLLSRGGPSPREMLKLVILAARGDWKLGRDVVEAVMSGLVKESPTLKQQVREALKGKRYRWTPDDRRRLLREHQFLQQQGMTSGAASAALAEKWKLSAKSVENQLTAARKLASPR